MVEGMYKRDMFTSCWPLNYRNGEKEKGSMLLILHQRYITNDSVPCSSHSWLFHWIFQKHHLLENRSLVIESLWNIEGTNGSCLYCFIVDSVFISKTPPQISAMSSHFFIWHHALLFWGFIGLLIKFHLKVIYLFIFVVNSQFLRAGFQSQN